MILPGLLLLVKQNYGSEFRNKTLASLKPEMSQALGSLLDELRSIEDTKATRIGSTTPRRHPYTLTTPHLVLHSLQNRLSLT